MKPSFSRTLSLPPIRSFFSKISTSYPADLSEMAADNPPSPAPMIATRGEVIVVGFKLYYYLVIKAFYFRLNLLVNI